MSSDAPPLDRRQRRRLETIEEVLDIAVELMTRQGVAGLSIGEIARGMGIQPPSLYVYFPSKIALYDALFARGARSILAEMEFQAESSAGTLEDRLLGAGRVLITWSLKNPAYSQLLFWRPVPGFTPSAEAYEPAVRLLERSAQWITDLQAEGLVRTDVAAAEVLRDWTIVTSGVFTQQLANAPHEDFDNGTFTSALPGLVAMFARHYGTPDPPKRSRRSARHADPR